RIGMLRDLRIKGSEPLFLEAGGFRLELHLRGVVPNCADLALGPALWSFVRRLFWVFHLVPLPRAALLAPAIISALGKPDLTGRFGNALTSRDQHVSRDIRRALRTLSTQTRRLAKCFPRR